MAGPDIKANIDAQARKLLMDGQYLGKFDQIRSRYFYSSALLAPGIGGTVQPQKLELYKSLAGDIGQGYSGALTERETNWLQQGRTPDQQNLLVKAWGCNIRRAPTDVRVYPPAMVALGPVTGGVDLNLPPHPADVYAVSKGITLNIKWLTNEVPQGILADFPCVGGLIGWDQNSRQRPNALNVGTAGTPLADITARGKVPIARNAVPAAFERRKDIPEFLEHGKQFSVILDVIEPIVFVDAPAGTVQNPQLNDASGCLEIVIAFWAIESFVEKS